MNSGNSVDKSCGHIHRKIILRGDVDVNTFGIFSTPDVQMDPDVLH